VPKERLIWQDNVPENNGSILPTIDQINDVKSKIRSAGLSISQLVETAWASASTYRQTDHRGGANGARIRLSPQKDWAVNKPEQLQKVLPILEKISKDNNMSIADMIVLAGCVGVEDAIAKTGLSTRQGSSFEVPFTPGRTDATPEQTDVDSFKWLEPKVDSFRNYLPKYPVQGDRSPEDHLLDRAHMLNLTAPEMTVLLAGLRTLLGDKLGQLTDTPCVLDNSWFKTLLSMDLEWKPSETECMVYNGFVRKTGEPK